PSLPPFAMYAAFPRSDDYGGSAPRPRHRRTWRFAGLRGPGARLEVPVFPGGTRGAVGGRLYPWQRGPPSHSGRGGSVPMPGTPSRREKATRLRLHTCEARVLAPYRGFHRRLQRCGLTLAPPPDVLGAMERILAEEVERLTLRLAGVAARATGCIGFP